MRKLQLVAGALSKVLFVTESVQQALPTISHSSGSCLADNVAHAYYWTARVLD
jgi:hypothetical protein